jgi:hypothetical protein
MRNTCDFIVRCEVVVYFGGPLDRGNVTLSRVFGTQAGRSLLLSVDVYRLSSAGYFHLFIHHVGGTWDQ